MKARVSGTVAVAKGSYGFIKPDAGGADVFYYIGELPEGEVVKRGDRVEFDIARDVYRPDKMRAVKITR